MIARQELPPEAMCIGCGCKDSRTCPGGCSWAVVDRDRKIGVCSCCDEKMHPIWNKAVRMAKKSGADFEDCLKFCKESAK